MLAPSPQMMPEAMPAPRWHDVTISCKRTIERACVEPVPPEEFGVSRNTKCLKDSDYCFHEVAKSEADLIEQGYDPEVIKALPAYIGVMTPEARARDTVEDNQFKRDSLNSSTRLVKITEHYVRMDYEGDDKTRLYRVTTGGDEGVILTRKGDDDVVEVDHICFAAMTPVIVTHRFFGRSIADLVMDIQRIKTALVRAMLDNVYMATRPRPIVSEQGATEDTLDDLLIADHGRAIRVKGPVQEALTWTSVPDTSGITLPAIQYWDATREWRTGVSRQGQGVDANALQNQVATIANQMFNAAQAKTKLIARIFAETGIRDLFSLLHATIRQHGSKAQTVRLRNTWVPVDPRQWKSRDDLTVKVGLGDGSKSDQLAGAQMLATAQASSIAFGLVSKKNLYNINKHLTRLLGHKNPDDYFVDPSKPSNPMQAQQDQAGQPLPPPPDPKQAEIAAKAQTEQAKMQADAMHSQAKLQGDLAHQRMKTEADVHMQNTKVQAEVALAQQKFAMDSKIAQEKHLMELEKLKAEMMASAAEHQQKMHETATNHQFNREATAAKAQSTASHGGHENHHEAMMAAAMAILERATGPKKIKGPNGKTYTVE